MRFSLGWSRMIVGWVLLLGASGLPSAAQSSATPPAKPVKLVLLGGQSNMAGMGRIKAIKDKALRSRGPAVKVWHNGKDTWVDGGPGHDGRSGYFGPEVGFGPAFARAFPKAQRRTP